MRTPLQKINSIRKEEFVKCKKCGRTVGMKRNSNKIILADQSHKTAVVYCGRQCWLHRGDK